MSGISQTLLAGGMLKVNLVIAADYDLDYVIYDQMCLALGYTPQVPVDVTLTVNPGVNVLASSPSFAAIDSGVNYAAGSVLTIINLGNILGRGGQGGQGGWAAQASPWAGAGGPGGPGGPALIIRILPRSTTVLVPSQVVGVVVVAVEVVLHHIIPALAVVVVVAHPMVLVVHVADSMWLALVEMLDYQAIPVI
mgnify:CR=1 FL=1